MKIHSGSCERLDPKGGTRDTDERLQRAFARSTDLENSFALDL